MKALAITGSLPAPWLTSRRSLAFAPYDFMAVGVDAIHLYTWPILYVSTFHPADIPEIYRRRQTIGGNTDFKIISHERGKYPHHHRRLLETLRIILAPGRRGGSQARLQTDRPGRLPARRQEPAGNDYNLDFGKGGNLAPRSWMAWSGRCPDGPASSSDRQRGMADGSLAAEVVAT